jgi:cytochrome c-type biogenesis protein CcmE
LENNENIEVKKNNSKFIVGGIIILAALAFLFYMTTENSIFFITVDELYERGDSLVDQSVQITGAVIGETIAYDSENMIVTFTIAHMPADQELLNEEGGLEAALLAAVTDKSRQTLEIVYYDPPPDLLKDQAQAIITGKYGADGIFYAEELLLKCPTRYEEAAPEQAG